MIQHDTQPDLLASVPDPATLRRMIAEHVSRAQVLRRLLRISKQIESDRTTSSSMPAEGATHAQR